MLVTALEANPEVSKMESVTKRLRGVGRGVSMGSGNPFYFS